MEVNYFKPSELNDLTILSGIEASKFIWDSMWQKDQISFIKYNILDAVYFFKGEIQTWLFTSSDGSVKRKATFRWNPESIMERCKSVSDESSSLTSDNIKLEADMTQHHVYGLQWSAAKCLEDIKSVMNNSQFRPLAIVSHGHLFGNKLFVEAVYEGSLGDIQLLKCTSYILTGSRAKGTAMLDDKASSVPTEKILSVNKLLNESIKKNLISLARYLQVANANIQICKLVVVFICESNSDMINDENTNGKLGKTIWFHHAREVVYKELKKTNEGQNIQSELDVLTANGKTIKSRVSDMKTNISNYSVRKYSNTLSDDNRLIRCSGDFCRYCDKEERRVMNNIADESDDAITAAKRAMKRNALSPIKGDIIHEIVYEDDDEGDNLHPDMGNSSTESHVKAVDDTSVLGNDNKDEYTVSLVWCIPFRSISLARQEMTSLLETSQASQEVKSSTTVAVNINSENNSKVKSVQYCPARKIWPEPLLHWWLRIGKLMTSRQRGMNTNTSSSSGLKLFEPSHFYDEKITTRNNHTTNSKNNDKYTKVNSNISDDGSRESSMFPMPDGQVPYDLSDHPYQGVKKTSLGIVSKLYSDVKVCERCYKTYIEIDTRRLQNDKRMSLLTKAGKDEDDLYHNGNETRKHDRKIQKELISRLCIVKEKNIENETDNKLDNYLSKDNNQAVFPLTGRVLPPLPWQLTDTDKILKYQQVGSAFVRNIGQKAKDIAHDAHFLNMSVDIEQGKAYKAKHKANSKTNDKTKLKNKYFNDDDEDDILLHKRENNEWETLTKGLHKLSTGSNRVIPPRRSLSEGSEYVMNGTDRKISKTYKTLRLEALKRSEIKTFNPERLLHPYQRDLNSLRSEMKMNSKNLQEINETTNTNENKKVDNLKIRILNKKDRTSLGVKIGGLGVNNSLRKLIPPDITDNNPLLYDMNDLKRQLPPIDSPILNQKRRLANVYQPKQQGNRLNMNKTTQNNLNVMKNIDRNRTQSMSSLMENNDDTDDHDDVFNLLRKNILQPNVPSPNLKYNNSELLSPSYNLVIGMNEDSVMTWQDNNSPNIRGLSTQFVSVPSSPSKKRSVSFSTVLQPSTTFDVMNSNKIVGTAGGGPDPNSPPFYSSMSALLAPSDDINKTNTTHRMNERKGSGSEKYGFKTVVDSDGEDDNDENDDDDADEGIGWSPFVVPPLT